MEFNPSSAQAYAKAQVLAHSSIYIDLFSKTIIILSHTKARLFSASMRDGWQAYWVHFHNPVNSNDLIYSSLPWSDLAIQFRSVGEFKVGFFVYWLLHMYKKPRHLLGGALNCSQWPGEPAKPSNALVDRRATMEL